MIANIFGYKNTGFSRNNIPENKTLLQTVPYITFDAVWVLQDYALSRIRAKGIWSDFEGLDYISIGDTYYFVEGLNMVNENTCEIALSIDVFTTVGLENINIVSGWCTRRHVTDDTLFSNTLPEPFEPQQTDEIGYTDLSPTSYETTTILGSTISLEVDTTEMYAKTFSDAATDLSVTVPLVPTIEEETEVRLTVDDTVLTKRLPNTSLYSMNGGRSPYIMQALKIVRSLGLDSCLVCCYSLPVEYIKELHYASVDKNYLTYIQSRYIEQDSNLKYKWSDTIKNNKVFNGQFNVYTLYSKCSGDRLDFPANEIYDGEESPVFVKFCDASPEGRPYCRPRTVKGFTVNEANAFVGCVCGEQWQNTPFTYLGASGIEIARRNLIYDKQKNQYAYMSGFRNSLGSLSDTASEFNALDAIYNPKKLLDTVFGSSNKALDINTNRKIYQTQLKQNEFNYLASNVVQPPDVMFPRAHSLQDYTKNGFFVTRTRITDADAQRLDRYLTMYGYAVSEPLTEECLKGRKYFNYVQATEVTVKVGVVIPMYLKQMITNVLESGVRIWHVLPDDSYYNNNPIV